MNNLCININQIRGVLLTVDDERTKIRIIWEFATFIPNAFIFIINSKDNFLSLTLMIITYELFMK